MDNEENQALVEQAKKIDWSQWVKFGYVTIKVKNGLVYLIEINSQTQVN